METDENGNVFVANFEGLMYYDHANWRILRTPGISRVTVVVRTSDNSIWVGGYNYFGKVERKANGEIYLKRIGKPDLFHGEVNEIFERDGKVRFIVNDGNIYQVNGDKVSVWKTFSSQAFKIGVLDVVDIDAVERGDANFVKDDILIEEPLDDGFVGVVKKGVGVVIRNDKGKDLYAITDANGLCSNDIVYLSYDQRGQLWGATAKGVFSIQVPSPLSRFTPYEGLTGTVVSIEKFGGRIYAGTDDGLFRQEGMRFDKIPGINHSCQDLKHCGHDMLAATADGIFCLSAGGGVRQMTTNNSMALLVDGTQIYSGEFDGVYQYDANGQIQEEKIVWDAELDKYGHRTCMKKVTTKLPATLGVYCYMKLKEGAAPQAKYSIGYGHDYTFYSATAGDVPISNDYKGEYSGPTEYDSSQLDGFLKKPVVNLIYQYDSDGKCTKGTWQ